MKIATLWTAVPANKHMLHEKTTRKSVVWHQEHTHLNASVPMEMDGMVVTSKLTVPSIVKTLHLAAQSQSQLNSTKQFRFNINIYFP